MDLNLNWRVLDVDNKATYPTVENHVIHFFVQSKMGKKYHLLGYLCNDRLLDLNNVPIMFTDKSADIFWYYTPTVPNVAKTTSCKKSWSFTVEYPTENFIIHSVFLFVK